MPLIASQSGLGAIQGLHADNQDFRNIGSAAYPSQHPILSQSQSASHQQQVQQQQHFLHSKRQQSLPTSTSPSSKSSKMTTTTTTATTASRRRTNSNMTSVIEPSALQYASKFSNANNNVIITTAMPVLSTIPRSTNPAIVPSQLHIHHNNNTKSHISSSSSTTTTFYSGVKLAPPVLSASVEQLERRASDQKVWYTIRVYPCDLTIITPVSLPGLSSNGSVSTNGGSVTSIPRKPYNIYRRYEDIADFADQLEEEFIGRLIVPSSTIDLQHDTKRHSYMTQVAGLASGGRIVSNNYSINGNIPSIGSTISGEKIEGSISTIHTGNNTIHQDNKSSTIVLPRLKSSLVLFVTKAVCLQRKEELDRYLHELFALGPTIAQSRLVAEFFGIWKTDMEIHLSQEDQDPLALHAATSMTTITDSEKENRTKNGQGCANMLDKGHSTASKETQISESSNMTWVDSPCPSDLAISSSPDIQNAHSSHESSLSSGSTDAFPTDASAASIVCPISPSHSPSPDIYASQNTRWTPSLTNMLPLASQVTADIDSEMASPIEPLDSTHIGSGVDEYELGACAEIETPGDLTTRTIKKLRSLRRSNTSNRQQQHQEPSNQEDFGSKPASRSGSISGVPGTATSISSKAKIMKRSKTIVFRPEVAMQPLSSKNVIPPWNRIPSFSNSSNSSNSSAAPISPISPTIQHSATTLPISATSSTISTINTTMNEQIQASSPPSSDVDELCYQQQQPRKLTMSHSKTMSSISTIPSWSIGNNHADYPTLSPGPLASLMPSPTSSNTNNGVNVRSMSMTSGMTPTTLVAPWNRANGNGDTNTHLHSLIKVSGQISPSLQSPMDSPFIPVELGRSFHKKESQAQKSPSNRGVRDRSVPLLAQPPEARNRNSENGSSSFPGGSISKNRVRKPGMTHSVSAPGGFLPIMTISAPDGISKSTDASDGMTGHPSIIKATPAATQKRTSLYSPSLPSKQPVGILKNAQRGIRKASLTVPGAVMFPVHASSMSMMASYSVSSSPSTSVSSIGNYGAGVLATTFKIVKDTDTIVALQVLEDSSFVLTLPELRSRVKAKLIKSNIQLPDQFDLLWTMPTNSMTLTSISTPMLGTSVTSIKQAANSQGVILKTDEDLHRAIHASRNHKVTLRCIV